MTDSTGTSSSPASLPASSPASAAPTPAGATLDVAETLSGKRILFIGGTGFVGKVAMSMLLCRYPGLGQLFALVRPGSGYTAETRFFQKIARSRPFDPVKARFGDATESYLREKVTPLAGDVSRPQVGLTDADLARLTADGPLDLIINCAGLVSFNPSLESAMRINVHGVRYVVDLARKTGAKIVHVSTCFVAGRREGEIWEDEPLVGYFPRRPGHSRSRSAGSALRAGDFDPVAEIVDAERLIEETRRLAEDRAHMSLFRERGAQRLKAEGRDADDERHLKAAIQRERKMWTSEKLTALGMERAAHWGWTNTYTYTKSIGDQLCALAAKGADGGAPVPIAIVRPAIVESSVSYPFPGWNEGFNTTAPLVFMVLRGHMQIPAHKDTVLDLIPVDMVAAGLLAAVAATLRGENELVYHLGSSDSSPFRMPRSVELTGLYRRRHFRKKAEQSTGPDALLHQLRARMESIPVSKSRYQHASLPLLRGLAEGASRLIDDTLEKTWGLPRLTALAERAKQRLDDTAQLARQGEGVFDLFMPFVYDNAPIFRCDRARALHARLAPQDQAVLRWEPHTINWRQYFMEVHLPGLEKWIFPSLDEEFQARPRTVYTYRDLNEMLETAVKTYRSRTALRMLPPLDDQGEPIGHGQRYTYRDLLDRASHVADTLRRLGLAVGGRVMIVSENRPEWVVTYFGVLKAGGVAVPVDREATLEEVVSIARHAAPFACVVSDKVQDRIDVRGALEELAAAPTAEGAPRVAVKVLGLSELVTWTGLLSRAALPALPPLTLSGRADEMASLIFTSGTTGRPKGVMLSHRNFASLLSKLAAVFDLDKHDGLLSVLPLHHTFEFTAGMLMPLMRGAQITYLSDVNADTLSEAFSEAHVTGMVGVPALYQALYRRVTKQIIDRLPDTVSPWVLRLLDRLLDATRWLRERSQRLLGFDPNLARLIYYPIHRRFGGKLRLMISGGSALPVETMGQFRGLGFNLYEGYGMTESAPVLTVTRPGQKLIAGSVGEALAGIDVRIHEPDSSGVGEVIASGPNVMLGYYNDPEQTAQTIRGGFLHTGDLGRLDDKGNLFIVGRKKEVIIGNNGENVYPDELEDRYRESTLIKELSIVGVAEAALKSLEGGDSTGDKGETVACIVVPAFDHPDASGLSREAVRDKIRTHFRDVSSKLPVPKRVKILHFTDIELPKTTTRKVKRKQVVEEIVRLERVRRQANAQPQATGTGGAAGTGDWLLGLLASVTGRPVGEVTDSATLQELGLDSLSFAELAAGLEAAGVNLPDRVDLAGIGSVSDLRQHVAGWGRRRSDALGGKASRPDDDKRRKRSSVIVESTGDRIYLPEWLVGLGNRGLNAGQRALYERMFSTRVTGKAYLPPASRFIVAANHCSHLDMGLVKHALGDWGERMVALAAKDYFFDDPLKRVYFENFTNLVPMERHGSLRESLRLAARVIEEGHILLIFPEGTRSPTGIMQPFKSSIGYLALHHKIDVLPMYLAGTYDAMPRGSVLPQRKDIAAHIGPLITHRALAAAVTGVPRSEQNREATRVVERAVRRLAPAGPDRDTPVPAYQPGGEGSAAASDG